ncbi:hypothetical protein CVIRNUC_006425 [Coccomyxa viridis]|uniref:Uncharacterized protein n=1 Tax=Coccomyxa viridis TaxID=1274662 RepID=A0AAV1I796_9CHLO|nr:hypothetical protein CVIRNUC_006425 [Coccomyxa viridis]
MPTEGWLSEDAELQAGSVQQPRNKSKHTSTMNIGSQAGLSDNVHILSGAVGVPESRIELEVEFDTLAELEHFWAAIPPQDHKAWSQRAQHLIIDGSPKWDIYRTVPVSCSPSTSAVASMPRATNAAPAEKSAPAAPAKRDRLLEAATKGGVLLSSSDYTFQTVGVGDMEAGQDAGGMVQAEPAGETDPDGRRMVLDWKGDPMYINPGDKMPM